MFLIPLFSQWTLLLKWAKSAQLCLPWRAFCIWESDTMVLLANSLAAASGIDFKPVSQKSKPCSRKRGSFWWCKGFYVTFFCQHSHDRIECKHFYILNQYRYTDQSQYCNHTQTGVRLKDEVLWSNCFKWTEVPYTTFWQLKLYQVASLFAVNMKIKRDCSIDSAQRRPVNKKPILHVPAA